jgi:hypothetical protein
VISALSISFILIAVTTTLIIFGMNFLSHTEANAADKQFAEGNADFIRDHLLYAHSIEVVRADTPPTSISEGELLFIGREDPATGEVLIANEGRLYRLRPNDSAPTEVFVGPDYRGSLALAFRAIVDDSKKARTAKAFEITTKSIRDGQVVCTSKKTFNLYNASLSREAEPRVSLDIDSWNDSGFAPNESNQHYYLLIKST